jgi:hypothetical protein
MSSDPPLCCEMILRRSGVAFMVAIFSAVLAWKSSSWYINLILGYSDARRKYLVSLPAPNDRICLGLSG